MSVATGSVPKTVHYTCYLIIVKTSFSIMQNLRRADIFDFFILCFHEMYLVIFSSLKDNFPANFLFELF